MIIKYSDNPFKQVYGIAFFNRKNIFLFSSISLIATLQYQFAETFGYEPIDLPIVPVTILGGALAIFLGFRNNSAYDRWWEARKIWGGIVNASRSWGMMITTFVSAHHSNTSIEEEKVASIKKELVHRHISWLYALIMHLRKINNWDELEKYISKEEIARLKTYHNKPCHLLHEQGIMLQETFEKGLLDNFRHIELSELVKEFYDLQGKAERIKGTVFPYYYNYFTIVFLWLFVICLPFALAPLMGIGSLFMSMAISFVFVILEKSGAVTEDPFENRAADTPISTITRNIEIDLLEMIGSHAVPAPVEIKVGRFGVQFRD